MKPGTTYAYMARLFSSGWSIYVIAKVCQCEQRQVERAIRQVMVREATKRR